MNPCRQGNLEHSSSKTVLATVEYGFMVGLESILCDSLTGGVPRCPGGHTNKNLVLPQIQMALIHTNQSKTPCLP